MKKTLITILTLAMMLAMLFNASAAEFEVGKHADSAVVNIKGRIEPDDIVNGKAVTVAIIEDLGLETERVAHIDELEVNEAGIYGQKFVCDATDDAVLRVSYNNNVINDSLIEADINGVSKLLKMDIVILSDRGGAFNQKDWGEMPVYEYINDSRGIDATYQAKYEFKETEGVQGYIKVENLYGFEESFTPIVACYDENNKLLGTKIFDTETIGFYDKTKVVQTEIIDLPDGTVRAKAFAWNSKDNLIPMGDSNEGELEKINVILVGASTAQDWSGKTWPLEGFGRFLGDYFNPEYVNYYNKSVSGASTTSFLDDAKGYGNWDSKLTGTAGGVMDVVREGAAKGIKSYVIIELGGNDTNRTLGEDGKFSAEKFTANLHTMYNDVKNAGGEVIFVAVTIDAGSPVDGKLTLDGMWTRQRVTDLKRQFAEEVGADFITCEQETVDFYNKEIERLGGVDNLVGYYFRDTRYMTGAKDTDEVTYSFEDLNDENVFYSDFQPNDKGYKRDSTHTNVRGAEVVAQKFYEAIVNSDSILKAYTK